jgi:3-methyladenine DNA glycosylase AlkD
LAKAVTIKNEFRKTASQFIARLKLLQSDREREKIQRYFKPVSGKDVGKDRFMGVKMGQLFALAKEFEGMPVSELEKLLASPVHEIRAGAVSIMDKESRNRKITPGRLEEFFKLYIRRHDRINNWDLVDLGCLNMTGRYLYDRDRRLLDRLVKSGSLWERRSAILSTCYFIRKGETADTFRIAGKLIKEKEDLVQKAVGWMLRFAGDKDPQGLYSFLDKYAAVMPRTMLRQSVEKLDPARKKKYMGMKKE